MKRLHNNNQNFSRHMHSYIDYVCITTATQMWCLGRFVPILIGQLIQPDDPHWENYLTLLSIMDHLFGQVTTADKADYMSMLVEDFLYEFRELYPERRLIP